LNSILKICGVAIIGLVCASVIRTFKGNISWFISGATGILIAGGTIAFLHPIVAYIDEISNDTAFSVYIETILKSFGISLISQVTSDVCRDCGENTIAGRVEFAAKACLMLLSLPIVKSLLLVAFEVMQ
jgi:stage III sporulation protein AD